jgi:hypothetical protein
MMGRLHPLPTFSRFPFPFSLPLVGGEGKNGKEGLLNIPVSDGNGKKRETVPLTLTLTSVLITIEGVCYDNA